MSFAKMGKDWFVSKSRAHVKEERREPEQMSTHVLCCLCPFIRAGSPMRGTESHDPITSQRHHCQVPLHWGLRLQHRNFVGHNHAVYRS